MRLKILTALTLLTLAAAPAGMLPAFAADTPIWETETQEIPGMDHSIVQEIESIKYSLKSITAVLNGTSDTDNPGVILSSELSSARQRVIGQADELMVHPDFEALKEKVMEVRRAVMRWGADSGNWEGWQYDGQTLDARAKKFIEAVENQLYTAYTGGVSDSVSDRDAALKKLTEILARPEFASMPALQWYKENIGLDIVFGIKHNIGMAKVWHVGVEWRNARYFAGKRDAQMVKMKSDQVLKLLGEIQMAGLDLKQLKVLEDDSDPISKEWSLSEVLLDTKKLKSSSQAAIAADQKKAAERAQKWKTLFKGDRKRILAERGEPSRWDFTMPEAEPEDALKSSWWTYYECASWRVQRETTYWFKGDSLSRAPLVKTYYFAGCE
ncbi:MAG TPA: hypothetical protein V6D23_03200 [Candidatus Obscuribacterales bacterium]